MKGKFKNKLYHMLINSYQTSSVVTKRVIVLWLHCPDWGMYITISINNLSIYVLNNKIQYLLVLLLLLVSAVVTNKYWILLVRKYVKKLYIDTASYTKICILDNLRNHTYWSIYLLRLSIYGFILIMTCVVI